MGFPSESSEDHEQIDNGNQHRTFRRDQSQGRSVQYTHSDERYLNQFDYRYSPNENDQRSYGSLSPAPPGFKQTESVFHILFVRNKK